MHRVEPCLRRRELAGQQFEHEAEFHRPLLGSLPTVMRRDRPLELHAHGNAARDGVS